MSVTAITITPFLKSFLVDFPPSTALDLVGYRTHAVHEDDPTFDAETGDFVCTQENTVNKGPDTTFIVSVAKGGIWYVKVAAYDTFGDELAVLNWSVIHNVNVPTADPLDMVPPDTPTDVRYTPATVGVDNTVRAEVKVTWSMTNALPDDFSNFLVRYRLKTGTNDAPWIEKLVSKDASNTCLLTPLDVNEQYEIQVSAVDCWANQSGWSLPVLLASTEDTSIVSPPTGLSFTTEINTVTAVWNPSLHPDFKEYELTLSESPTFVGGTSHVVTVPMFNFPSLAGDTWYVRVRTRTYANTESEWCAAHNMTTFDNLSANRITTGTLSASTVVSVGSDKIKLDGVNKRITINDADKERISLGSLATGGYGMHVKNNNNEDVIKVDDTGAVFQHATVGDLVVGAGGITCGTEGVSAFKVWENNGSTNLFVGNVNTNTTIGTNYLWWNGTSLKVRGDVELGANSSIQWEQVEGRPNTTYIDNTGFYTGALDSADLLHNEIRSTAADGLRYSALTEGDLTFYKSKNGQFVPYKYMKQMKSGVATSGSTVTLTDFDRKPEVLVSLRDLSSYKKDYYGQDQRWEVRLDDSLGEGGIVQEANGDYTFKPIARLILAANTLTKLIPVEVSDISGDSGWIGPWTTPANATSITVNGNVNSYRGTGISPNYFYRKTTIYMQYRIQGTGTWLPVSAVEIEHGADIATADTYTISKTGLPAALYEFQLAYAYADVSGGGSFSSGTPLYSRITRSHLDATTATVNASAWKSYAPYSDYDTTTWSNLGNFSIPAGYEIEDVTYTVDAWVTINTGWFGWVEDPSTSYTKTTGIGTNDDTGGTWVTSAPWSNGASLITSTVITASALGSDAGVDGPPVSWPAVNYPLSGTSTSKTVKNLYASITLRTPAPADTTAHNAYSIKDVTSNLPDAQVIDPDGVLNWIAIA